MKHIWSNNYQQPTKGTENGSVSVYRVLAAQAFSIIAGVNTYWELQ